MSKLETNTIDTISGSSTLKIGSTNTSTVDLDSATINLKNGSTTGISVDSNGRVTQPNNVRFNVYNDSDQSISSGVWTKINFDTETYDIGSNFDTTNKRFTAPVDGYYQFTLAVNFLNATTTSGYIYAAVKKNDTTWYYIFGGRIDNQAFLGDTQFNGTVELSLSATDYVEGFAYQAAVSPVLTGDRCYMIGRLVG